MASKPKLRTILLGVIYISFKQRRALMKGLIIPFVAIVGLDALTFLALPSSLLWLLWFASVAMYTLFAIVVHRIVLLGSESVPDWGIGQWTRRETFFTIYLIGFAILYALWRQLISFALTFSETNRSFVLVLTISSSLIVLYLNARLSLIFPGTAVDHWVTPARSWHLTRNRQILMICIVFLVPLFFGIPIIIVKTSLLYLPNSLAQLFPLAILLSDAANLVISVLVVGCLSLAYSEICGHEHSGGWSHGSRGP